MPSYFIITQVESEDGDLLERTGQYMVNRVDVRILSEDDKTFPIVKSVMDLTRLPSSQPSYNTAPRPAYPPNHPPSIVDKWFPAPAEEPQSPKSEPETTEVKTCANCNGAIRYRREGRYGVWVHVNDSPLCTKGRQFPRAIPKVKE